MDKLSEILKDFYKHFAGLGVYLIPGVVVLEVVFNIGFFGQRITTLYDFVFYIMWALILGIPFHYSQPKQLNKLYQDFKEKKPYIDKSSLDGLSDELELGFVFVKLFSFYIIYKIIVWQDLVKLKPWFDLSPNVANYLLAVLITIILALILIFPYKWYLKKRYLE